MKNLQGYEFMQAFKSKDTKIEAIIVWYKLQAGSIENKSEIELHNKYPE